MLILRGLCFMDLNPEINSQRELQVHTFLIGFLFTTYVADHHRNHAAFFYFLKDDYLSFSQTHYLPFLLNRSWVTSLSLFSNHSYWIKERWKWDQVHEYLIQLSRPNTLKIYFNVCRALSYQALSSFQFTSITSLSSLHP